MASLSHGPISLETIRQHTETDTLLQQVKEYTRTTWSHKASVSANLMPYYNIRAELSIEHECITRCDHRFVVPASLQRRILHAAHEGHPGIVKAKRLIRTTYWWPGLDT